MRNPLKKNQTLLLANTGAEQAKRELIVVAVIGMGANVIAYDATEKTGQIHYVLKECFPENGAERLADGAIRWANPDVESSAKNRMRRAYEMQLALQNKTEAENTNTHLVDTLFECNNTFYTITDHHNATAYSKTKDKTLQETIITARSIAKAVKAYHDHGYLHLDIKPQNVLIMPETRDMVLLLDFDSIMRADNLTESPLTYSPVFAAPEQLQNRVSRICAATDVYAVGAIVFSRVFNRPPALEDQSTFSEWDYSGNPLFEKLSMRARRLTSVFFRNSLAASVSSRYQTMDDLIAALDTLAEESDPGKRFIIDHCPACLNTFIGRESELNEIHDKLQHGGPVFITGMRGIGKTELAKNYARKFRSEYDVICFAEYNGSLSDLVSSGELVSIENNSDSAITIDSFAGLVDERTLLIIDNYHSAEGNLSDGKLFDKLASLKSNLLITTFENVEAIYGTAQAVDLKELNRREQFRLFEREYGETLTDEEATVAEAILKEVDGYTLLIPLIAKMLANSCQSFEGVLENIKKAGTTSLSGRVIHKKDSNLYQTRVADIVASVLDMSGLTEEEHYVMGCLSVLEGFRVERSTLINWIGSRYDNAVTSLAFKRWISVDGSGKRASLSMHGVIRDVVRQDKAHPIDTDWFKKPIEEYDSDICNSTSLYYDKDGREYRHFSGQWHPYTYPPMIQSVDLVMRLDGVLAIRFEKKRRLVNTLFHAMDVSQDASYIITKLFEIIWYDINWACNYAPDCDDLLFRIENSNAYYTLSAEEKIKLHICSMFMALKSLCECDRFVSRDEKEIMSLCRDVIRHAEQSISLIRERGDEADIFFTRVKVVYRACFVAGISLGNFLFTTTYPSYSVAARNTFAAFVNHLAEEIKKDYPKYTGANEDGYSSFDIHLKHFNACMEPDGYDKLNQEFDDYLKQEDEEYEDYERWRAEDHSDDITKSEEDRYILRTLHQIEKIQADAYELVKKCQRLGYVPLTNRGEQPMIDPVSVFDTATLNQASVLLNEAKNKYEEANRLHRECFGFDSWSSSFNDIDWLAASCIHAYCAGNNIYARECYGKYLRYSMGWLIEDGDKRIHNTLVYLGLSEASHEALIMNDQFWDEQLRDYETSDHPNLEWRKVCRALANAELLGDETLIRKYKTIKKKMEDTGFVVE